MASAPVARPNHSCAMETGSNVAQFIVRPATREDIPQLSVLLEHYYDEWEVVQRDTPQQIADYMGQPAPLGFVVVEEKAKLVGCVLLRALPTVASAVECKRLYVVPEQRGEGLASLLMDYVE